MKTAVPLQSVRVVTFDLDDTLFPEHQYVQSGFRAVSSFLRKQGLVEHDVFPALWHRFIDGDRTAVFNRVLEECGIEPRKDLIQTLVTVYRTHQPEITLYPDARIVLDFFYGRKPLALISDGYLQAQNAKIDSLGIRRYFNTIILTDQLGRDCWKPSPASFNRVMQELGGEPAGYVYIGDNPIKDFAAPRQLGWHTVCVRKSNGIYAEAKPQNANFDADFVVGDLYQAARLLDPGFTAPR